MADASATVMPPVLRFEGISKTFGGVRALDEVAFEVEAGEVHCLAGENGSGKSTLIKIITGVYAPDPGALMEFSGERVAAMTPPLARRLGIEVIWQDLALFPEMTVTENVAIDGLIGLRPRLVRHGVTRKTAAHALARLGVSIDLDAPLRDLPIAQRQLVAIARALVGEARVVFMDEPTSSLTQSETDRLLEVVRKLSADGVAVVFVSHRLAEVLEISRRVTVLRDGRLVGVHPTQGLTQSRLTELMTGKSFDQKVAARDVGEAPLVLDVRGLSRKDEYQAIDLTIRAGEIVGLIGLIGAGRTELGLTLFGMTRPTAGEVRLNGKPISLRSNREAVDAGIAYLSEDRLSLGLIQQQPIADNLALPVLDRMLDRLGLISRPRKRDLVNHWIRELAIRVGKPEDAVATLSGGNQQRVALAKWLATEPLLLILDSPTVGVDVGARAGIFAIVRRLAKAGLAILLISDEAPEVYFNADRVLHMQNGRIVNSFDPNACTLAKIEAAVYG